MDDQRNLFQTLFPDSMVEVCGFPIKLDINDKIVKEKYIPLVEKIHGQYKKRNKNRLIVGLSGASGSGKSVISVIIKKVFDYLYDIPLITIGIDAFHYHNDYLLSIKASEGNETGTLKDFKGRHDTYDTALLKKKIDQFLSKSVVSFPEYSRKLHNPIADKILIDQERAILFIEGLWIFGDYPGWKEIREKIDFKIFVSSSEKLNKERIINRHMMGGRTRKEAEEHYNRTDSKNFWLTEEFKKIADETITAPY